MYDIVLCVCMCVCVYVCVCILRYDKKHPHFYIGSLENAMKEVVSNIKDPDQVSMVLTAYCSVSSSWRGGGGGLTFERFKGIHATDYPYP